MTYEEKIIKRISELEKRTATRRQTERTLQSSSLQRNITPEQQPEPYVFPEEITPQQIQFFREGGVAQIYVNRYERDPRARKKCIEHHGLSCVVCAFNFESTYGAIGRDFIHVHHLEPISRLGHSSHIDPIRDMRPVCPNCHAIIHRREPIYTIDEVKQMLQEARKPT